MKVNKVWGDILTTLYPETKTPLCVYEWSQLHCCESIRLQPAPPCTLRFFLPASSKTILHYSEIFPSRGKCHLELAEINFRFNLCVDGGSHGHTSTSSYTISRCHFILSVTSNITILHISNLFRT